MIEFESQSIEVKSIKNNTTLGNIILKNGGQNEYVFVAKGPYLNLNELSNIITKLNELNEKRHS